MYLPMSPEQLRALADTWLEDTALWGQSPKSVAIAFWGSLEKAIYAEPRIFSEDADDPVSYLRQDTVSHIERQQWGVLYRSLSMVGVCALGVALAVLVPRFVAFLWDFF